MKIQKAVWKETGFVAAGTGAGTILMIAAFAGLHKEEQQQAFALRF